MSLRRLLASSLCCVLVAACGAVHPGETGSGQGCDGGAASATAPACVAALPVQMTDGVPVVTVWIDDQPSSLVLDTGASETILTPEAARRLGLGAAIPIGGLAFGLGGPQPRSVVRARKLAFGSIMATAPVFDELRLATSPGRDAGSDGSLGADILRHYDVDLDLPHGMVRLYRGDPGAGLPPGWATQDAVLQARLIGRAGDLVAVPVTLQGQTFAALLDSGDAETVVAARTARALGVPQSELDSDLGSGLVGYGPALVPSKLHRFGVFSAGGQSVPTLETAVVAARTEPFPVVLGADYLLTHKVWISYGSLRVHVAHSW